MELNYTLYIIDTTLFIDYLRAVPNVRLLLSQLQELSQNHFVGYSLVTELELWVGLKPPRKEDDFEAVLQPFVPIEMNRLLLRKAGLLLGAIPNTRGLSRPDPIDAIIAATALEYDCAVITRNRQHYELLSVKLEVYSI